MVWDTTVWTAIWGMLLQSAAYSIKNDSWRVSFLYKNNTRSAIGSDLDCGVNA